MKISTLMLAASVISALSTLPARADDFSDAYIILEQNVTDGDAEVVIFAKGGDDGLVDLTLISPDGNSLAMFLAPGEDSLGLREFLLESPEPDMQAVLLAYPEGLYGLRGMTASGDELRAEIELSHDLPPATRPMITRRGRRLFAVRWRPVPQATQYRVEIENDDLGFSVQATLPGHARSFAFPRSWLLPDTEYELGVATVNAAGNVSVAETEFETE